MTHIKQKKAQVVKKLYTDLDQLFMFGSIWDADEPFNFLA